MDDGWRLALTYLLAPLGAWFMWVKVARPCAAWILDRIAPGPIKDMLTKDRGGYY